MSKISINLCVVGAAHFSESETVELDPETTKNCYAACAVTLNKLRELGSFVEVIKVTFFQEEAKSLRAEFAVIILDPLGGPKFEIKADFPYGSVHVFSEETISHTLCHQVRNGVRERFAKVEATVKRIGEAIDNP